MPNFGTWRGAATADRGRAATKEENEGHPRPAGRPRIASADAGASIELDGVSKVFSGSGAGGHEALTGIDLALPAGSCTLVEGPSGSGKTTLLGLIGCMVRPTAGRIRIAGRETTRLPEDRLAELRRHSFGFVFQSHHLIRGASAHQNVVIPALPCPEVDGDLSPRAAALLARLGLASKLHVPVERLSGGEQQRVAIARAMINDPAVILADEPTAHLDPFAARSFLDFLDGLLARGKTVVVASHDPVVTEAELFDHRLVLLEGRVRNRTRAGARVGGAPCS